jgi:hypothetical protein
MEVTELTKEISKYEHVYSKLIDYLRYKNCIIYCDYSLRYKDVEVDDFSMLYGLLEDFFDEQEHDLLATLYGAMYKVCSKGNNYKGNKQVKQRAREQAILKTCEILEERLLKD